MIASNAEDKSWVMAFVAGGLNQKMAIDGTTHPNFV
jgi:hypothetical protein